MGIPGFGSSFNVAADDVCKVVGDQLNEMDAHLKGGSGPIKFTDLKARRKTTEDK
jgi:hypothetical protein